MGNELDRHKGYIDFKNDQPGILGPMHFRPETAKPLNQLAEVLLRGPSTLTMAERETIATYVSFLNECQFCTRSHRAVAEYHFGEQASVVNKVLEDYQMAPISQKLKSLLAIAENVQKGGRTVAQEQIEFAKSHGATDTELHDTVLIAAAFCMFNRYVDGLNTFAPAQDSEFYNQVGKMLAENGYKI